MRIKTNMHKSSNNTSRVLTTIATFQLPIFKKLKY